MQPLTIRLLGPVEVDRAGELLPLGGRLPRGALAVLALKAGTPVSVETMIAELWGDTAPAAARSSLAAHLSRLRRRGLGDVIRHHAGGYVLEVAREQVDLHRAMAAHADARVALLTDPPAAQALLDEAAGLWRGQPLAGLDGMPFTATERARCLDRLASIRHDRIDALLAAGRGGGLVDDLLDATRQHPLSERLWCQLMRALHADGRRTEALQAFQALQHNLRTELGLDPNRATLDLHRAVLRGDLDARRPVGVPVTASTQVLQEHARTPLVGRGEALARLDDLLATRRLVTLVGMSGIGKTRLATAHIGRAAGALDDGPWTCELSDVHDGAEVTGAVARALGLERPDIDTIVDAVGPRRVLLLLDGIDRVAPEVADLVHRLRRDCGALQVLVTGLTDLGLHDEAVLRLDPLPTGPGEAAEQMLRTAVRRWQPDGSPLPLEPSDVVALAQALEGIPLAIELAAAHLDHLPPAEVVALVEEHNTIALHAGGTATPSRHRTLRGAIRWSVAMVSDDAQQVLSAAAVFVGGFTPGALAGLLDDGTGGGPPVQPVLRDLRRRAMLSRRVADHGTRYHMLHAIQRQLVADRPARRTAELQDAHASWAHRLARRADAGLRTADQRRWWDRLIAETANLRAAVEHGLAGGDPHLALATAGHLGWWWYRRGEATLGLRTLERTLAAAPDATPDVRMRGHLAVTLLSYLLGDADRVESAGMQVLAGEGQPGADALAAAQAQLTIAHVAVSRGDVTQAATSIEALLRRDLPAGLRAEVLMSKGFLVGATGSVDAALDLLERATALAEGAGDWWVEGSARWVAAKLLVDRGDGHAAIDVLCPILRRFSGTGERTGPLAAMHTIAAAFTLQGDPARGALILAAVDHIGSRLGYDPVGMDPRDAPRHRAIVSDAAGGEQWDRAQVIGAGTTYESLLAWCAARPDDLHAPAV